MPPAETPAFQWKTVVQYGLIGGLISLYVSMIGMVETFSARNLIGTFFSMGNVLTILGALGAGLLVRRKFANAGWRLTLLAGLTAGLVASLPSVILVALSQWINLRAVFVNVSEALIGILTFQRGALAGSLLLIAGSSVLGMAGALFDLLSPRLQRGLVNGLLWTLGVGLFSENVGQIITSSFSFLLGRGLGPDLARSLNTFVFQNKSLSPAAAIFIFLLVFGLTYAQTGQKLRAAYENLPPARRRQGRITGFILLGLLVLSLPQLAGTFLSQVLFLVGLYVLMGLGLNIVVGYAGLLDLGYVAFFAFGAYTAALLTSTSSLGIAQLNFFVALPFAILIGVLFGVLLGFPVLRLRGDYLAIVTLGFGEIIRILALSDWLKPVMGGAQGVLGIPSPRIDLIFLPPIVLDNPQRMYYLVLFGALLAAFVSIRLRDSRLGRQWMAMREDEDVAEAMGINLIQTKLLAFAIGAGFSALAGAIFAARLLTIFPHSFNLLISINALSLIIVGGMGSIPGVLVGALVLVGLPELLREFEDYRLLMYGTLLIVMMLVKPEGFLPEEHRQRELHGEEEAPVAATD